MRHLFSLVTLTLTLTGVALSTPTVCPPDLVTDGIAVTASCAGLGADVFADPGTTWLLTWNDNVGTIGNDYDFNDLEADIVISANGTSATVTYMGSLSAINDVLYDGTQDLFSDSTHPLSVVIATTPGAEIPFDLHSNGNVFVTGVGAMNFDGQIHDWTQDASAVPEPGSLYLLLGGAALLGGLAYRRKAVTVS
jgi:hypothetical protein